MSIKEIYMVEKS